MKKTLKILALILCAALALTAFAGCGESKNEGGESTAAAAAGKHTRVKFEIESGGKSIGSFVIELYPEHAPISCANFEKLVKSGFYDGTVFHRVVDGFMAQGGAPKDPNEQPETIKGEFAANGVENELSHTRGVVSMARANANDSGSSQFFICYSDDWASSLDGRYAAFGKVVEGMDTVDKFCTFERSVNAMGEVATPLTDIVIAAATIVG